MVSTKRTRRRRRTAGVVILSILAETLLVAGGLVGLYALYESWWTELISTREADQIASAITDLDASRIAPEVDARGVGEPPTVDIPTGRAMYDPTDGAFGVLHIPRFGPGWGRAVYEGTTREKTLNPLGIGHYQGVAGPGEVGNFSLAGHRTTYSKPFNQIHILEVGDVLVFESEDTWYVYKVTVTNMIISPWQNEVLAPVFGDKTWLEEPTERTITLTSCHPQYSRKQRIVAHGVFDYWMPKASGVPKELG